MIIIFPVLNNLAYETTLKQGLETEKKLFYSTFATVSHINEIPILNLMKQKIHRTIEKKACQLLSKNENPITMILKWDKLIFRLFLFYYQ